MPPPENVAVTLTFDLLTAKSNHCKMYIWVKFQQAVRKISCCQTFAIWSQTYGQTVTHARRNRQQNVFGVKKTNIIRGCKILIISARNIKHERQLSVQSMTYLTVNQYWIEFSTWSGRLKLCKIQYHIVKMYRFSDFAQPYVKQLLTGNNGLLLILTRNITDLSLTVECFCDYEKVTVISK